jgi:hypothetical protein
MRADPLDFPGATSGDVHTGIGKPASGQTSNELHRGGNQPKGGDGTHGLQTGDRGVDTELRKLGEERSVKDQGSRVEREHNVSLDGAETKEPVVFK